MQPAARAKKPARDAAVPCWKTAPLTSPWQGGGSRSTRKSRPRNRSPACPQSRSPGKHSADTFCGAKNASNKSASNPAQHDTKVGSKRGRYESARDRERDWWREGATKDCSFKEARRETPESQAAWGGSWKRSFYLTHVRLKGVLPVDS